MSTEADYDGQFHALCQALCRNLNAALKVAGQERSDGSAGPLRNSRICEKARIARSTMEAIKRGPAPNPDLRTLSRLASMMKVPTAFLLMRSEDWETLIRALLDIRYMAGAAEQLLGDGKFGNYEVVQNILRKTKSNIPTPVIGPDGIAPNQAEQSKLEEENENRRKVSRVLGALMLERTQHSTSHSNHVALAAFAASIANQSKSS